MSPALLSHASLSAPTTISTTTPPMNRPQEMDARGERGSKDAAICPTDDETVTPRKRPSKQSVDYLWRSGLAGGLAGCAVCDTLPTCSQLLTVLHRPNHLLRRLTESKSSFNPPTHNSPDMPDHGLASSLRWARYTEMKVSWDSTADTPLQSSVYSLMLPSSS